MRIRRVAGRQASRPLLIDLKVGRMLKRTSGLNKLMSIVHKMSMEFENLHHQTRKKVISGGREGSEKSRMSFP